jgi:serine/threonine-protein kinase
MNNVRATRLSKGQPTDGFLANYLPPGSRSRKLVFRIGIPILIGLLLLGIVDKVIMPVITRQGTEFPLPSYINQRVIEAQLGLEELDLSFEIAAQEYSPGKSQGVILSQIPLPHTKVKPGRNIKFVVSLGQKLISIPDLAGKTVRQAMLDLETAGLFLGEIAWAFSDTLPERLVVFSYPAAATEIPLGSAVNLMVNRGRASSFTYTPKLIGKTQTEAVKLLAGKSLRIGVIRYRTDENYLPETVLEQSEPEGAELDVGTEIDLVISTTE